ncbi:MAG: alanine racemase protein [Proteobacteria bacterium]|nr:alanine racemase protein [Pseudomonadota bacterium]
MLATPTHIDQLDTPVPVVDLDRAEANIARYQAYCTQHGLALRPHIKTHKLIEMAQRQLSAGAVGINCQKISEAEAMLPCGAEDILITYNIFGAQKLERLARLARQCRITLALDSAAAIEAAASAARIAGCEIGVLIDFDAGGGRTGVQSATEAVELAQQVCASSGLQLRGVCSYPILPATAGWISDLRAAFSAAGLPWGIVSSGGTPAMWHAHETPGLTEMRVGTYIYQDRATVAAGAANWNDVALQVWSTVVSRPTPDRAVLDAGSKTLSSDLAGKEPGYGYLPDYPAAVIVRLNEEHGIVDLSRCERKPALGERVRIIPNHVCVVTNLHDRIVLARNGQIEAVVVVAARGATT